MSHGPDNPTKEQYGCPECMPEPVFSQADLEARLATLREECAEAIHPEDCDEGSSENCLLLAVRDAILTLPLSSTALELRIAKAAAEAWSKAPCEYDGIYANEVLRHSIICLACKNRIASAAEVARLTAQWESERVEKEKP